MRQQESFWDERIDETRLGSYVYALIDPNNNEVFYIGLGGGLDGQGNLRPNHHLLETRNAIKDDKALTPKQAKIKQIWESGKSVGLKIVRRNIKLEVAKNVEAALIDLLRVTKFTGNLTNIVAGHGSNSGLIDESNLSQIVADRPSYKLDNLWLFEISGAVENENKSPFNAVIGDWIISDLNLANLDTQPQYAVGLIRGVSRVVIQIKEFKNIEYQTPKKITKKKRFVADDISNNQIGKNLFEKDFSCIVNNSNAWKRNGGRLRVNLLPTNHKVTWGIARNNNQRTNND